MGVRHGVTARQDKSNIADSQKETTVIASQPLRVVPDYPLSYFNLTPSFIAQGKKSRRNKSKSGSAKTPAAAVSAPPRIPVAVGGGVPNPRLDFKQHSECSHGCNLAAPGTKAHKLLHYCLAGLNAGVDGFPNHCKDAVELEVCSL